MSDGKQPIWKNKIYVELPTVPFRIRYSLCLIHAGVVESDS
jgi:hypothetical protein